MQVFLFPLVNISLFPGTTKPLNVFEARYLEMIKRAAETKTPIAIGYIEDTEKVGPVKVGEKVPFVREVAGIGYVQVLEERVNGTLLVFIQGFAKVRLDKVIESGASFIVCEAEIIPEVLDVREDVQGELLALLKILTRWVHSHIPEAKQRELFMLNIQTPEEVVGGFASYLVRDYDMQQMVLEFDDLNDKIRYLHRLMSSVELTP